MSLITDVTRLARDARNRTWLEVQTYAAPLSCVGVFAVMLANGWGKWANPIVDFGRELYVPWRLCEGEVLYRDIAYFNGPLSPYWNALVFWLSGSSIRSITIANGIVVALLGATIFHLARKVSSAPIAAVVVSTFLVAFAFAQHSQWGAYNYLAPYSHELTHGVLLAMLGLACALAKHRYVQATAGLIAGLLLLGKPETFVAYTGAIAVLALCSWWDARASGDTVESNTVESNTVESNTVESNTVESNTVRRRPFWVTGIVAGVIPPLVAVVYFGSIVGWASALRVVFPGWIYLFTTDVGQLPFYKQLMGLHAPVAFGGQIVRAVLCLMAALFAVRALVRRSGTWDWITLAASGGILIWLKRPGDFWLLDARAFLLLGVTVIGAGLYRRWSSRLPPAEASRNRIQVVWATFGLMLMLKLGLRPTLRDYGFVLAMPMTMLGVCLLLEDIPRRFVPSTRYLQAVIALTLLLCIDLLSIAGTTWSLNARKTLPIAAGANRFYTYDGSDWATGVAVNQTLAALRELPTGATVAAVPEGIMLNFLAGRPAPSRQINFMPPEFEMFGDSAIVADFAANPADIMIVVDKDVAEYGIGPFGSEHFGRPLMQWIDQHYVPWKEIDPPHSSQPLPIRLMRRRTGLQPAGWHNGE